MPNRVSTRFSFLAVSSAFALALIGCVDARGEYDDFGDRLPDDEQVQVDAGFVSQLPDVDGEWLLAVHPAGLPEDRILYFRTTLTLEAVTENTGLLDLSAQPLAFEGAMGPVGDAFVASQREVGADASFTAPFVGTLPAEANPVTGSNAAVNAEMQAILRSDNFVCGTLTGQAGALPLEGTTWGAVRITGDTLPTAVIRCDDEP